MDNMRGRIARIASACAVVAMLTLVPYQGTARAQYRDDRYASSRERSSYNSDYIFATTRAVNEMDAPPAVRVILFPVTLLVDVVLLPAELIGGLFG